MQKLIEALAKRGVHVTLFDLASAMQDAGVKLTAVQEDQVMRHLAQHQKLSSQFDG